MFDCEPDNNERYGEGLVVLVEIELFEINGTSFW